MKCPSCGAETRGKFCEYCGSEMPQEKPQVGGCPKCGSTNVTFKREWVGTSTQRSSHKNIIGTGRTGQSVSQSAYRTVGLCQNCGFTWNPNAASKGSSKKTWLWVLGWICIFPVPLTILMLRKKDMKPAVKYGIIAAAWLLLFVIGLFGNSETDTPQTDVPGTTIQTEQSTDATTVPGTTIQTEQSTDATTVPGTTIQTEQSTDATTETTEAIDNTNPYAEDEATIRKFVDEFNAISDTPVTDIEFIKNHSIAYLVVDGFEGLSIKVNDHSEMGFFFTFEFSNGTAMLEQYENLMRDIVKVFDSDVDVGEKFQEANTNQRTIVNLSDNITVEYHYIKDAVGYQAADTYIITLTSLDYNKQ